METSEPLFPIFCYGSNHPVQIANRLGLSISDVLSRAKPCVLKNFKRGFMNSGPNWGGKSVGTVIESEGHEVRAFAFYMTQTEVDMMDEFEGYPIWYLRKEVDLIDKLDNSFKGQVYQMNPNDFFAFPDERYLKACTFTSMAHYYLDANVDNNIDYSSIKFEVWDCAHNLNAGDFEWNDIQYPEELKKLVKVLS